MSIRKLIEVALPLEVINEEASRRKRKAPSGYPTTLHKWWSVKPVAASRAVLFASLVDDPSSHPERFPTEEAQHRERERLFGIIERLVKWESTTNEYILREAREEILKHTGGNPPLIYDPFAGGGAIPLEAQRLGLEVYASDLNPVAVLINKALIEIPPKFANLPPVNLEDRNRIGTEWKGTAGLAADVHYYGRWMCNEAYKLIGHLYPKVKLPKEYGAGETQVVAWLWTRTVRCPNPACNAWMPLAGSFALNTKKGKEVWVEPVIERGATPRVHFRVQIGNGKPPEPPKIGRGAKFRCLCCGNIAEESHIKFEAKSGRMAVQLMATVAEGQRGRICLSPNEEQERIAASAEPVWKPDQPLADDPRNIWCVGYGLDTFDKLFTQRQIVALTTFTSLVDEVRAHVRRAAEAAGDRDSAAYADGVATYIGCAISRVADYGSSITTWRPKDSAMRSALAKQAIPMMWNFAEGNPFGDSSSGFDECCAVIAASIERLPYNGKGVAWQQEAQKEPHFKLSALYCTDPPYYDNVSYADISDFLYVWLRQSLRSVYPELTNSLLVPKSAELVASPHRFNGSKAKAEKSFESGLGEAFAMMRQHSLIEYPLTVFYAFKQSESEEDPETDSNDSKTRSSTGWETMLAGLRA